jgi:hypothetical protein
VDSGTSIVAMMITLPGAMSMATSAVSTPAAVATLRCTLEVSGKSSMLPLAVSVTRILAVEGGSAGGGGGLGEGGGGEGGGSVGGDGDVRELGGGKGEGKGSEGERGGSGEGTPQTISKSNRHPVPAVQPSASSVAVQSLAPAAWQIASASANVLSRAHAQPASDSPHTEQPLRRDCQAGESLTSEQQRTWPRVRGRRGEHAHRAYTLHSTMGCRRVPRAARPDP